MNVPLIQRQATRAFIDLTEAMPQLVAAVKDRDGRYVYANAGFTGRLGVPIGAVLGRTVEELFPAELARSYAEQDRLVLSGRGPLKGLLELIVRADRSLGWYVTSKTAVVGDDRAAAGVAVLSVDLHSQMSSSHAGLAEVVRVVRGDVSRRWRLADLAAVADLSPKQLQRVCRHTLGISPQQLVQRMRIEEAVRLATTTDLSLGRIGADCGFYDQPSFTRQFRRVLGLTPGAYRTRVP